MGHDAVPHSRRPDEVESDPTDRRPRRVEVYSVAVSSLVPGDSPRLAGENRDHVLRLVETEADLPPLLVHRPTMRVIDGMHRLRAAILKGRKNVEITFFAGTEAEAFVRAVEENVAHGLPLTPADRRAAARRIVASLPQLSDRMIASRTGLSARTVGSIRRSTAQVPQSNMRIGADGRQRPLNGAEGRRLAAEAIAARPDAPLREIARTAGVAVSTAHDVRQRLQRGEDPVPRRYAPAISSPPARRPPAAVPPARVENRRTHHAELKDRVAILQRLTKDPSLRHSGAGRELLRLLHSRSITTTEWSELLNSVPTHCRDTIAEFARQCARAWQQFAEELERR
jgi:ParB-like chromosome segregation protein Spo0J